MMQKKTNNNKRYTVAAVFAGALLTSEMADAQTRLRGFIGVFDKGQEFVVGTGVSRHFNLPRSWSIDGSFGVLSNGRTVELSDAEIDFNTPNIGPVSLTAYAYNSRLYNVDFGAGATLTVQRFHASIEYEIPNWAGVFANYQIPLGDRVSLTPQAIFLFSQNGAEGAGAWLRLNVDLGNSASLQVQANQVWGFDGRPLNMNAIMTFSTCVP